MSYYTSENTHILATHMQAGNNERMLLFHICENGRHEYVIGSYFHMTPFSRITFGDVPTSTNGLYEYEWDWGHYFSDVCSAVDYWRKEVLNDGDV